MEHLRGYDAWKSRLPDVGGSASADPDRAFWEGFRFFERQGLADAYLDAYRGSRPFAALVARAEQVRRGEAGPSRQR